MGKRCAIVIGVAALGAALIAVGASANFRSVDDPRGDARCVDQQGSHGPCSDRAKRNADIVRATAGHEGGRLKHTIRVVGKFHAGGLLINTDSDPDCDLALFFHRGGDGRATFRTCGPRPVVRTGRVSLDFHRHSVEILFSKRSIGNPSRYGWTADATAAGLTAQDSVPNGSRYIPHRLG